MKGQGVGDPLGLLRGCDDLRDPEAGDEPVGVDDFLPVEFEQIGKRLVPARHVNQYH
jgi:hypothetical protein